jgi:predicted nucleic acid-binding protein
VLRPGRLIILHPSSLIPSWYRACYHHCVRVVIDTNVLVAAIRSRLGASYELVRRVGTGAFDVAVSVPLVLEYEDVLLRHCESAGLTAEDVGAIVDYFCSVAVRQEIFFLWRPLLRNPGDDMVLEIAVAADCDGIVTHKLRDFMTAARFGMRLFTPAEFLNELRGPR